MDKSKEHVMNTKGAQRLRISFDKYQTVCRIKDLAGPTGKGQALTNHTEEQSKDTPFALT